MDKLRGFYCLLHPRLALRTTTENMAGEDTMAQEIKAWFAEKEDCFKMNGKTRRLRVFKGQGKALPQEQLPAYIPQWCFLPQ